MAEKFYIFRLMLFGLGRNGYQSMPSEIYVSDGILFIGYPTPLTFISKFQIFCCIGYLKDFITAFHLNLTLSCKIHITTQPIRYAACFSD